jgi:hypothetical protein
VAADPSESSSGSRPVDVGAQLDLLLGDLADRIVELGTRDEAPALEALARAAREASPGSAAALVDWDGSEIARLRAFGIVHGVVLRDLSPVQQTSLLDGLRGSDEHGRRDERDVRRWSRLARHASVRRRRDHAA